MTDHAVVILIDLIDWNWGRGVCDVMCLLLRRRLCVFGSTRATHEQHVTHDQSDQQITDDLEQTFGLGVHVKYLCVIRLYGKPQKNARKNLEHAVYR